MTSSDSATLPADQSESPETASRQTGQTAPSTLHVSCAGVGPQLIIIGLPQSGLTCPQQSVWLRPGAERLGTSYVTGRGSWCRPVSSGVPCGHSPKPHPPYMGGMAVYEFCTGIYIYYQLRQVDSGCFELATKYMYIVLGIMTQY